MEFSFAATIFFETEKKAEMEAGAADDQIFIADQPSVPSGDNEEDTKCGACHDAFQLFHHEEKDEWHLRPAVKFEGRNYHPACLEDVKVCF